MSVAAEQALKNYQAVRAHASVAAADPYRLVQLMLENVLQRIAAQAAVLAVEARKTLLLDKPSFLAAAREMGIVVVGVVRRAAEV